jgi:hypothetical protein
VWNSYWKKELLRLGTYYKEDELIVGGEKQLFKSPNPSFPGVDFTQKKAILIPYETDAPKDEVKVFIDMFKKSGFKVYFKIRSDISKEVQCQEYGLSPGEVRVITDYNPIISEVALIVGVYSTFLYDLIGSDVPVAIFETSMDYGYGMVENGLAGILYKDGLIQDQVTRICREYPVRNSLIGKIFSEKKLLTETIETISKQCNITSKK